MKDSKIIYHLMGLVFFILYSSFGAAMESDSEQPITIDSNSATYDEKNGISIYIGNVISIQGSMKVDSDKLVAYLRGGDVTKLVWTGKPVRFRQDPGEGQEQITGTSLKLEYYPDTSQMVLIDESVVTQGDNTYTSDLIKYNSKTSVVTAGKKNSDSKRVRVILKPKKKQTNNDQASSKATR